MLDLSGLAVEDALESGVVLARRGLVEQLGNFAVDEVIASSHVLAAWKDDLQARLKRLQRQRQLVVELKQALEDQRPVQVLDILFTPEDDRPLQRSILIVDGIRFP